ncbi:hypothetical protein S101446_00750 [Komagataeibacter europaeus]|nr:hypothetical protein S101446_00750 [Komagataeibacter europaeus]
MAADHPREMVAGTGIGLSGQQRGAVLRNAHGNARNSNTGFPVSRQVYGTIALPVF